MNTDRRPSHARQQELRLLPILLVTARRRIEASQKAIALDARLNQSYLCALENGRRQVPRPEVLEAISAALKLGEADGRELVWAAAHDRVLETLSKEGLASHAPLISAALRAAHYLLPRQLDALEQLIQRHARSGQELHSLEAALQDNSSEEEAAMT